MVPMFLPIFGSRRHASKEISLISSTEVTRIAILDVMQKTVQEPCAGSGKCELNSVSKSESVMQCHSHTLPNDREGMSVMAFSTPGIWTGVIGQVRLIFILNATA